MNPLSGELWHFRELLAACPGIREEKLPELHPDGERLARELVRMGLARVARYHARQVPERMEPLYSSLSGQEPDAGALARAVRHRYGPGRVETIFSAPGEFAKPLHSSHDLALSNIYLKYLSRGFSWIPERPARGRRVPDGQAVTPGGTVINVEFLGNYRVSKIQEIIQFYFSRGEEFDLW